MRFPWRQVIMAFFGLAFAIVILERAGGFSLVMQSGGGALGDLFTKLTPAPNAGSASLQRAYAARLRR